MTWQVLANFLPSLAKARSASMMRRTKSIRNIHQELLLLAHQAQSSKPPADALLGFRNSTRRSGKVMAGVEMTHIPYRGGGPAVTNLLGGQVDVFFAPVSTVMQYIKADKLRALAVTGTTRFQEMPDVPAASDFVPGYEASYWIGLGAPKKTPEEIITRLNKEVDAALASPDMQARFAQQGAIVAGGSPSDFEKFISDETLKWGKVIKAANIKPE